MSKKRGLKDKHSSNKIKYHSNKIIDRKNSNKFNPSLNSPLPPPRGTSPNLPSTPAPNLLINSPTGIQELDVLIGGGFPKGAVVLLAGSSGSGKTIFSMQWLFEGLKYNDNGVYISMTEPLFKSLKNLETMGFYDRNAIEQEKIKIIDIRSIQTSGKFNPQKVLDYIEAQVKLTNAKRLCIDSITAIAYNLDDKAEIRKFIFELGKILATLGCTTILTSEKSDHKYSVYGVEEFISDAILNLDQIKIRDELQRVLQIIKIRGRDFKSEDLDYRITSQGIIIFPKPRVALDYSSTNERISSGNALLDKMVMGGLFRGSSSLIVGSSGTGKSLLSMQFVAEGLRKGETCLYAGFEESREQIIRNAHNIGYDFEDYEKKGLLSMRCVYPGEKFLEEHLVDIKNIVENKKIMRVAVDSLSAISSSFENEKFRRFSNTLNGYLKKQVVTTFFTTAAESFMGGAAGLTETHLSTMTDNIIVLRYTEVDGTLKHILNVVKVRGSAHSKGLREYNITSKGIIIGQSLSGYEGVLTGTSRKVSETNEEKLEAEFKKHIGPIGSSAFHELKEKGMDEENIFSYIEELLEEGILKKENAELFKRAISTILGGGTVHEEGEEEKIKPRSFAGLFKVGKK